MPIRSQPKTYLDGFVLPVPTKKLAAYRKIARLSAQIWIEHGALEYCEAAGDALAVSFGRSFAAALSIKKTDTLVFAWVLYPSKAARRKINARVMADPRLQALCDPAKLPFDINAMCWGGFKTFVHRRAP